MIIDALVIFLIQATPFTYVEDCKLVFEDSVVYHFIQNGASHINVCKDGWKVETIVHELWHELHYLSRSDTEFKKLTDAFDKLNALSSGDSDYITKYAQKNVNEDFAETFEEYYKLGKKVPTQIQGDWISSGKSKILVYKFIVMEKIVQKYTKKYISK